jgi:hypothetical protein
LFGNLEEKALILSFNKIRLKYGKGKITDSVGNSINIEKVSTDFIGGIAPLDGVVCGLCYRKAHIE